MKILGCNCIKLLIILLLDISVVTQVLARDTLTCRNRRSRCFLKRITCPEECPSTQPHNPKAKACFIDCFSPTCQAQCKHRIPNCNGFGAACYDPRFIGGDGIVFYFHGKSNEHFSLVSDTNLQINAKFIGLRPVGRTRDYTWIQALGILFDSHTLSLEAIKATKWDDDTDHLKFSYDGQDVILPEGYLSVWNSKDQNVKLERITSKNTVIVSIPEVLEIAVKVVPVTKEDNKVHNYQIPSDDCFAHLEVQFRFFGLSSNVEGVIGRTYQPDFQNPAKPGVAMPVVGGENKYRTTSLLSADCSQCMYTPIKSVSSINLLPKEYGTLDCTSGLSRGIGIVCKR